VIAILRALWLWGEAHAGWILAGGVGLAALLNLYLWRRWRRDASGTSGGARHLEAGRSQAVSCSHHGAGSPHPGGGAGPG